MGFTITVVYDNETLDESLATDWGFAAVVKDSRDTMLLFDTGADGDILERNMRLLQMDPQDISIVVLSHWHWDHSGGLSRILEKAPRATLFVPPGQQRGPSATSDCPRFVLHRHAERHRAGAGAHRREGSVHHHGLRTSRRPGNPVRRVHAGSPLRVARGTARICGHGHAGQPRPCVPLSLHPEETGDTA